MMTGKRITNGLMVAVVAMGIMGLTATSVQAQADIVTPTAVVESPNGGGNEVNMIDGSGLSGGGTSGDILNETHAAAGGGNYWVSTAAPNLQDATGLVPGLTFTFTLPADSTVGAVHHWPAGNNATIVQWGFRTFDISFSFDGGSTFPTTITGAELGDFVQPPIGVVTPVQSKTFAQQTGVDAIRLSNIYCFGENAGQFPAIMEIRFGEGTAPPPPATPGTLIYGK